MARRLLPSAIVPMLLAKAIVRGLQRQGNVLRSSAYQVQRYVAFHFASFIELKNGC